MFVKVACSSNHLQLDRPHPYVLQLLDEVHINKKKDALDLWLIFEYGLMDLHQFVHERHLTNVRSEALQELCKQMADGLNHFHSLGLLHRDLKPANILIFMDSNLTLFCKIADLGMVRQSHSGIEMTPGLVTTWHLIFVTLMWSGLKFILVSFFIKTS
jgi:serine/threonine protein kinase